MHSLAYPSDPGKAGRSKVKEHEKQRTNQVSIFGQHFTKATLKIGEQWLRLQLQCVVYCHFTKIDTAICQNAVCNNGSGQDLC